MTGSAIAMLVAVWSIIAVATGYCFFKLMNSPRRFDQHDD